MCFACAKTLSKTGMCTTCQRIDRFVRWVAGDNTVLATSSVKRGKLTSVWIRRMFFASRGNACEKCGWSVWSNGLPLLHISHIDDDYKNMSYENLEALCPNCHAVWTYRDSSLKFDGSSNGRYVNNTGRWQNGIASDSKSEGAELVVSHGGSSPSLSA